MKRNHKIALTLAVVLLLAVTFWWGGNAPGLQGSPEVDAQVSNSDTVESFAVEVMESDGEVPVQPFFEETEAPSGEVQPEEGDDTAPPSETYSTDSDSPGGTFLPDNIVHTPMVTVPPPAAIEQPNRETGRVCTISIRCDTILQNLGWLDEAKHSLVPENGIILPSTHVEFQEGDSAFAVLRRETKRNSLHFEYTTTPSYNTTYIEGIANLYELDCGERSGWLYRVNGVYPNVGAARYTVQPGDKIEWIYTCDGGADIGAAASGGRQ